MSEFDDIAPYPESELPGRLAAIFQDRELLDAVSTTSLFPTSKALKPINRLIVRLFLANKARKISNRVEWHELLAKAVEYVVNTTTDSFTYSGLELVPKAEACLFISNHRDITLDPILVNYALWLNDFPTTQIAIGDNLISDRFESEFMRINNSFIVVRSAGGFKATYAAMNKTSRYIRRSLNNGESIWIAQREGRAKDGLDRTDPALLKMFGLAYRDESHNVNYLVEQINVVPLSITYEFDPCAPLKARELAERERTGSYVKHEHEDRDSIVTGITGLKGRVHVAFSEPLTGPFTDFEDMAQAIDQKILAGRAQYAVFESAAELLSDLKNSKLPARRAPSHLESQMEGLDNRERMLLLEQYANQFVGATRS